jgi:hypothetical protein
MDFDLDAERCFRKYDFEAGTEEVKEKKPKRAKKKEKMR